MTQTEINQIKSDFIQEAILKPYRFYIKTGNLTFGITPFRIIYETLENDLKFIALTPEEKREIYDEAKIIIAEQFLIESPSSSLNDYKAKEKIKNLIKEKGIEEVMKLEIKNKCYEISIKRFFEQVKRNGRSLETEIELYLLTLKNN